MTFSSGNVEIRDYLITPRKLIILFKYNKADSLSKKKFSADKSKKNFNADKNFIPLAKFFVLTYVPDFP